MRPSKKVLYDVQCAYDDAHVFQKNIEIEAGSEDTTSEIEAFCPYCGKHVSITIQGKAMPNQELLRRFNLD